MPWTSWASAWEASSPGTDSCSRGSSYLSYFCRERKKEGGEGGTGSESSPTVAPFGGADRPRVSHPGVGCNWDSPPGVISGVSVLRAQPSPHAAPARALRLRPELRLREALGEGLRPGSGPPGSCPGHHSDHQAAPGRVRGASVGGTARAARAPGTRDPGVQSWALPSPFHPVPPPGQLKEVPRCDFQGWRRHCFSRTGREARPGGALSLGGPAPHAPSPGSAGGTAAPRPRWEPETQPWATERPR